MAQSGLWKAVIFHNHVYTESQSGSARSASLHWHPSVSCWSLGWNRNKVFEYHTRMMLIVFSTPSTGSSGSNCSKNEGRKSGGSGSETEIRSHRAPSERSVAPPSERSVRSSVSHRSANSHSIAYGPGLVYGPPGLPPQLPHLSTAAPGAPQGRELASVPPELTASRQSLRMAVGNAGEFFVDVMWRL